MKRGTMDRATYTSNASADDSSLNYPEHSENTMATVTNTFNFHCSNPVLAARLASIRTSDLEVIFKQLFGTTVNIMQKFPRPPKCEAAKYIVDNAPTSLLNEVVHFHLGKYEKAVQDANAGRPVNVYLHDGNRDNNVFERDAEHKATPQKVTIEYVPEKVMPAVTAETQAVIDIVNDAMGGEPEPAKQPEPTKQPEPVDNTPSDEDDDIAQQIARLIAGRKAPIDEEMIRAIAKDEANKALIGHHKVTLVKVESKDSEGNKVITERLCHAAYPDLLNLLQCGYPVWLPGPAGSGKTTAAMHAAEDLKLDFYHTGAVGNKYELVGFRDATGHVEKTAFRLAWEFGGVFLWDEVDASNPAALVAFNAALENGICAFPDGSIAKHPNFTPIAAANTHGAGATNEYVGRTKIDAATVDRFVMLDWEYDEVLERKLAQDDEWVNIVQKYRRGAKSAGIKVMITPRASYRGAALRKTGNFTLDKILAMTVFKGVTPDQIQQIKYRS